jgi:transposase
MCCIAEHGYMGKAKRSGYPSDVSDEEWEFVAPYLTLCREDAPQREYPLRAALNAVRYVAGMAERGRR